MAPGLDAELGDFYDNFPDDALVVRTGSEEGVTVWQWFITIVGVLALLWNLYVLVMWLAGTNVYDSLDDESGTSGDEDGNTPAEDHIDPPAEETDSEKE